VADGIKMASMIKALQQQPQNEVISKGFRPNRFTSPMEYLPSEMRSLFYNGEVNSIGVKFLPRLPRSFEKWYWGKSVLAVI